MSKYLKQSSSDEDKLDAHLYPGSDQTPRNSCSGSAPPDALVVLLGSDAFAATSFPYTVLSMAGKSIASVDRHPDGSLGLNFDLIGLDGRRVVKILDNKFMTNLGNISLFLTQPNHLVVIGGDKRTLIDLVYLNAQAVRIKASFSYQGVPVSISDQQSTFGVNGMTTSGNCVVGGSGGIRIR